MVMNKDILHEDLNSKIPPVSITSEVILQKSYLIKYIIETFN